MRCATGNRELSGEQACPIPIPTVVSRGSLGSLLPHLLGLLYMDQDFCRGVNLQPITPLKASYSKYLRRMKLTFLAFSFLGF